MPKKGFTKSGLSESELRHLYFDCNLSHAQIGEKVGCSRSSVQRLFNRYSLKARTNAESQTAINITRTPELNEQQYQLIYGSLLGDACLNRAVMKSNKTGKKMEIYKIHFYHTERHLQYVEHKADLLGIGVKTKRRCKLSKRVSGHGSVMRGFAFSHTPTLRRIARDCLDANYHKKITPEWLDKINWHGLAYWFMDDGSLLVNTKKRRASIAFYTQSFGMNELKLLLSLLERFGLHAVIGNDPNGSKKRHIILLHRQDEVRNFLTKTEPFIVPCMDYKNRILREKWGTIDDYNRV